MRVDKHRIPGSVDKHLPDFRGQSLTADELTTTTATGLKAELSSDQSYSTSDDWVTLALDQTKYDDQNGWDTSANNWSAPHAGRYHVIASVRFAVAADGDGLGIRTNGDVERISNIQDVGGASSNQDRNVSAYFDASENDTLRIEVINFDNDDTIESSTRATFCFIQEVPSA